MPHFLRWTALLVLSAAVASCITTGSGDDQTVNFAFRQPGTECAVKLGLESVGAVSNAKPALTVPRSIFPLELDCKGRAAQLQAKVHAAAVETAKGQTFAYPDKVTIDLAARTVSVPTGWGVEIVPGTPAASSAAAPAAAAKAPAAK
jgi:hypothetical protein